MKFLLIRAMKAPLVFMLVSMFLITTLKNLSKKIFKNFSLKYLYLDIYHPY